MHILFYIFVAIFSVGVLVNFIGPEKIKLAYADWGLPAWFRFLTGSMELLALILVFTNFIIIGYLVAGVVMAGAIFLMLRSRLYKDIVAPGLTLLIIAILAKDFLY